MTRHNQYNQGFALLMTLLVVGAVVSITLAVIELTIRQLNLSVTAKDSEIAFHATNAGLECARYVRRVASSSFEVFGTPPNTVSFECFNTTSDLTLTSYAGLTINGNGEIYRYTGSVTWGTNDRCSVIDMIVMLVPDTEVTDLEITNLTSLYAGFPAGTTKSCSPGAYCTVAEVVGYNRSCANINVPGTVRREILLEF
ncbi:MAG: hypothetical protein RLZZ360_774 [Candidatus Parcubacteria bacterium]